MSVATSLITCLEAKKRKGRNKKGISVLKNERRKKEPQKLIIFHLQGNIIAAVCLGKEHNVRA